MSKTMKQYTVQADAATGEWIGSPEYVGLVDAAEWHAKVDTAESHYDTYEEPIEDSIDTETRAIEVVWVE